MMHYVVIDSPNEMISPAPFDAAQSIVQCVSFSLVISLQEEHSNNNNSNNNNNNNNKSHVFLPKLYNIVDVPQYPTHTCVPVNPV